MTDNSSPLNNILSLDNVGNVTLHHYISDGFKNPSVTNITSHEAKSTDCETCQIEICCAIVDVEEAGNQAIEDWQLAKSKLWVKSVATHLNASVQKLCNAWKQRTVCVQKAGKQSKANCKAHIA